MPLEEAKKKGAKAFFDDKYGDVVRVVQVVDDKNNPISIELCG
jgi:alanyl-tRNA synthetase